MPRPIYVGTNEADMLYYHDALRLTFAQESSWFVPSSVEAQQFAAEVANMVAMTEEGSSPLVPVSDVTVPPGAVAFTIDFIVPGDYGVSVGQAISILQNGLRAGWTGLGNVGYIQRVQKLPAGSLLGTSDERGGHSDVAETEVERESLGATLERVLGKAGGVAVLLGVVGLVVYFGPEIKAALATRRVLAKRRAA